MILAGDIGGTKTHLAWFEGKQKSEWEHEEKYVSANYESLLDILRQFLLSTSKKIEFACFGIAGPVKEGKCHATNLPWIVDASIISKDLKIPHVWLINDLEANAYGLKCLSAKEFFILNEGKADIRGNSALIAAGTGLGEAGIFWDGKKHIPFASEGGHCSFAPEDDLQMRLLMHLKKKYLHVSYERLLSGPGLYHLYRFLIDEEGEIENENVKKEMQIKDPPRVITEHAVKDTCTTCKKTVDLFVSIYGSESGNLALKFLPISGLYIGGGIAPKIKNQMKEAMFMQQFIAKGRFSSFLKEISVKIILNENTALLGAAQYVRERI